MRIDPKRKVFESLLAEAKRSSLVGKRVTKGSLEGKITGVSGSDVAMVQWDNGKRSTFDIEDKPKDIRITEQEVKVLTKKNLAKAAAAMGGAQSAKAPEKAGFGGPDPSADSPERGQGRTPPSKAPKPPPRKSTTAPMAIGGPKKKPPAGSLAAPGASI